MSLQKFDDAYTLEMYIANVEAIEGDGDLYSKFGIRVTDQNNVHCLSKEVD